MEGERNTHVKLSSELGPALSSKRTARLRRLPGAPILEMPRSSAREADAIDVNTEA